VRRQDWPERMVEAIEAAGRREDPDGRLACAEFAADVVLAMTGEDLYPWRGMLPADAYREMLSGAPTMRQALAELLGPEVHPAHARRGDVVVRSPEAPLGEAIGICCGRESAFVTPEGVGYEPTLSMAAAFRID
jgi:hypothetical protein